MNNPASPDSFEHSRLADLVALHQAIAALGQALDYKAVIHQRSALYDRLRELHPTMISEQECFMYREQVRAIADVRKETLGVEGNVGEWAAQVRELGFRVETFEQKIADFPPNTTILD